MQSVFVHAEYEKDVDNNVAILHIEPFEDSDSADILTAIDSPDSEENCKVVGWLRQVRYYF